MNLYTVDEAYFDKITDENRAYWMGMLLVTGDLRPSELRMRWASTESSTKLLSQFKKDIGSTAPIVTRATSTATRQTNRNVSEITIYSKILSEVLLAHRENPDIDRIPRQLLHHFWRGFFDKKGSVVLFSSRAGSPPNKWRVRITGDLPLLNALRTFIASEVGETPKILRHNDTSHKIEFNGKDKPLAILNILYKNAKLYDEDRHSMLLLMSK